jgi:hypothetical protein
MPNDYVSRKLFFRNIIFSPAMKKARGNAQMLSEIQLQLIDFQWLGWAIYLAWQQSSYHK